MLNVGSRLCSDAGARVLEEASTTVGTLVELPVEVVVGASAGRFAESDVKICISLCFEGMKVGELVGGFICVSFCIEGMSGGRFAESDVNICISLCFEGMKVGELVGGFICVSFCIEGMSVVDLVGGLAVGKFFCFGDLLGLGSETILVGSASCVGWIVGCNIEFSVPEIDGALLIDGEAGGIILALASPVANEVELLLLTSAVVGAMVGCVSTTSAAFPPPVREKWPLYDDLLLITVGMSVGGTVVMFRLSGWSDDGLAVGRSKIYPRNRRVSGSTSDDAGFVIKTGSNTEYTNSPTLTAAARSKHTPVASNSGWPSPCVCLLESRALVLNGNLFRVRLQAKTVTLPLSMVSSVGIRLGEQDCSSGS
jgi:hypothetical protein